LAGRLTLSQPRGTDYAQLIITLSPSGFSDLPTALLPNHERMELCNPAEVVRWQEQHTVFKPFEVFLISIDFFH
jgi:hypothetical protein